MTSFKELIRTKRHRYPHRPTFLSLAPVFLFRHTLLIVVILLLLWSRFPTPNPAAETLPEESEAYQSGGIVASVGPSLQPVPAALLIAQSPPGTAIQTVGSGQLTLTIDETVNPAYEQYILDLFDDVYPAIVDVYGQPSNTVQVAVHFDDTYPNWFFYNSSSNQVVISTYPHIDLPYDPSNPNDPHWDGIVTHELVHAFHDTVFLFASWAEEGMTEAATELVADRLLDEGVRDIRQRVAQYNLLMSDTWNMMGATTLGGTTYSLKKALPDLFYRSAAALFWKLTTSQTVATAGDWPHYDFLKRLNQALYDYAETTNTFINQSAFLSRIEITATEPVDGRPASAWVEAQPITDIDGSSGTFLGVYPSRWELTATNAWVKTPANPDHIYAFAFRRTLGQTGWNTQETLLINGDRVSFVVEDATGVQVHAGSIVLDRAWAYEYIDTSDWAPGAYRIRAETIIDGEKLKAENVFIIGPSVVSREDGIGLILLDESGGLVPASLATEDGTLTLNVNAAAIVVPNNLDSLPESLAVNQQPVSLPLPYTRIRTLSLATLPLVCQVPAGDVNGDGWIDLADIQLVVESWRLTDETALDGKDLNRDGRIDVRDILITASAWGAGCN